jgi:hypothetical protein
MAIGLTETISMVKCDSLIDFAQQCLANTGLIIPLYRYEVMLHIRPPDR